MCSKGVCLDCHNWFRLHAAHLGSHSELVHRCISHTSSWEHDLFSWRVERTTLHSSGVMHDEGGGGTVDLKAGKFGDGGRRVGWGGVSWI